MKKKKDKKTKKLRKEYKENYKNQANYIIISTFLSSIQATKPLLYSTCLNTTEITSELYVSKTPIINNSYLLIGLIVIEGILTHQVIAYCLNRIQKSELAREFFFHEFVNQSEYSITTLDNFIKNNFIKKENFYENRQKDEKTFYFFYYRLEEDSGYRLNSQNLNNFYLHHSYPIPFLRYLELNIGITKETLKQLLHANKKTICSTNDAKDDIYQLYINYDKDLHSYIKALLKQ